MKKSWLSKMVSESNCELRDDTNKLLGMMQKADIPVLVMSAGVGDLIQEILKHFNLVFSNLSVGWLTNKLKCLGKSLLNSYLQCPISSCLTKRAM